MKCHYCENEATHKVIWLKDKRGRPAIIPVFHCGCDLMKALTKWWKTPYQIIKNVDYEFASLDPGA